MKKIVLFIVFFLTFSEIYAQLDSSPVHQLEKFVRNIRLFNRLYPQEKVYLHFDNTGYYLDETIWFKAYAVSTPRHLPDTVSRVLYVELLNPLGTVLETKKLKIENGQCHGDFFLTPFNYEYMAGFYEIRAYTKWMLNYGEETIFSRVFPVFNEPGKEGDYTSDMKNDFDRQGFYFENHRKKATKLNRLNLMFYPEGGSLVMGLSSTVAFKATDSDGKGVSVSGKICNPKNQTITEFSSIHGGMGSFEYLPDENRNEAKILYENKEYTFDLPKSLSQGYALKVNPFLENYLLLQIEKSQEIPTASIGISILCRGEVVFFQAIEMDSKIKVLKIPKQDLRVGVNQITLFDAKGEIFAERSVFIYPQDNEKILFKTQSDKKEYTDREWINIDISGPENVFFSLSVRDASTLLSTSDVGNCVTDLLLSSDLKGFIENPDYYISSQKPEKAQALNLLMLVQSWKRYEWQSMAGVKPVKLPYDVEKGLKIKGNIIGKASEIHIWAGKDDYFMEGTFPVDKNGDFTTYLDDFEGVWSLSLRSRGLAGVNKNIRLDRWFSPAPRAYFPIETSILNNVNTGKMEGRTNIVEKTKLNKDSISGIYEIQEIEVNAKKGKDIIYHVEKDFDRWIDRGDRYLPPSVHDYLVEKNNGYIYKSDDPDVPFDNALFVAGGGKFIFGVYGADIQYVDANGKRRYDSTFWLTARRNLDEVQKIIVSPWKKYLIQDPSHKRKTAVSPYNIYISIYPYESNNKKRLSHVRYTFFEGFSRVKDFYQDTPERENYLPDKQERPRTLYWNPNVRTDKQGKARIGFYNNRSCKEIDISAEGITREGIPFTNKYK
jgi:hypothetical protein